MKAIDPNAVIDAIARLFPDGFEYADKDDEWPRILMTELGLDQSKDELGFWPLGKAIDALRKDGRLRYSQAGYEVMTLSHTEQARRVIDVIVERFGFIRCGTDIESIANVLAGKTEKT